MNIALMKALILIADFCKQENNCDSCPMKALCGKMPSEW